MSAHLRTHTPGTPHRPRLRATGSLLVIAAGGLLALLLLAPPAAAPILPEGVAWLRLNPNTATRAELELLPHIGPALADAIVAFREASPSRPAFHGPEDLQRVPRIGPVTVARLRPYLTFLRATERENTEPNNE